MKQSTTEAPYN